MMNYNKKDGLIIESVKIEDIKPSKRNAKKHPAEQIEQIRGSIKEFGFNDPIAVDEDNVIIEGHGRLEAAKKLDMKEVPIIRLNHLNKSQKKAYIIAHNKLCMNSDFDMDILKLEFADIEKDDWEFTGFDFDELDDMISDSDDEESEDNIELSDPENYQPISQLNDVWILGNHKLICGDCLDSALIKSIIGDDKIALVYNDPPYGIDIVGIDNTIGNSKNKYKEVLNDKNTDAAKESITIAKSLDAKIISWGANHYAESITNSACWIVWDKRKDGDEGKLSFADCELAWTNIDLSALIYRQEWNGCRKQDIFDDDEKHRIHPTQKPVGLAKFCIKKFTKRNDVVLDMFGGSAPTIMACEELDRKCITFELDPYYIDHIIKRWQKYTEKDAVNLATGKTFNSSNQTENK